MHWKFTANDPFWKVPFYLFFLWTVFNLKCELFSSFFFSKGSVHVVMENNNVHLKNNKNFFPLLKFLLQFFVFSHILHSSWIFMRGLCDIEVGILELWAWHFNQIFSFFKRDDNTKYFKRSWLWKDWRSLWWILSKGNFQVFWLNFFSWTLNNFYLQKILIL